MELRITKESVVSRTNSLTYTGGNQPINYKYNVYVRLSIERLVLLVGLLIALSHQLWAQTSTSASVHLTNSVNKSKANEGDVVTHTLVLTNSGASSATNILVNDSLSTGLRYQSNSVTKPTGSTFTPGVPINTWRVPSLSAGQSVSLTYTTVADSSGVLYSKATIPGDTATACISIPIRVCEGDTYLFQLTGPAGRSSYRWYKDGIELTAQTTRVLNVTAAGSYSLAVDSVSGKCPDFSCCPFIIEKYARPTFEAHTVSASCSGSPQANGQLILTGFGATDTYQFSEGTEFNPAASLSGTPAVIPANGLLAGNLPNPTTGKAYSIRVYNAAGCYIEKTVILLPTVCCSLTASALPGSCTSATNTFSTTVVISLTNPTAGTLTLTDGPISQTYATTTSSTTLTAVFDGLIANGNSHTVIASLPGCSTTTTSYTAPASCAVNITLDVQPGDCLSQTNSYSITGSVSFTNAVAGTATITDGTVSETIAVKAGERSVAYSLTGLVSGSGSHTVTVGYAGQVISTTYTAPAPCRVDPPIATLTLSVTPGSCSSATNQYSLTGTIGLTAAPTSSLTVTDGLTTTTLSITAGQTSSEFSLTSLISDASNHILTVAGTGFAPMSITYTAPASCSIAPMSMTLSVTDPGVCVPSTNLYTSTGVITLTNTLSGTAVVTDGTATTAILVNVGDTSAPYSLTGLLSGSGLHTVTVDFVGQTASTTYTAPESCSQPAPVSLDLEQLVDKSKAHIGDVLTYTLVLTNTGTTTATLVTVDMDRTARLHYITSSISPPAGTTFDPSSPLSTWTVASLSGGQSLSLTFQAIADSSGILYNKASIPGDTATVCTSIPVKVCAGEAYNFRITAAAGRSSYQWFRTFQGVTTELTSFTTNVLDVTQPGEYKLTVDNTSGQCPDFSCCPFIVEEDSLPTFKAQALAVSCLGSTAQANGQLVVSGFPTGATYQYSLGTSFNAAASLSGGAKAIPVGGVLVSNLANPVVAQAYTIRVYNSSGCFQDQTVLLVPTVCGCPAEVCVPFVISQTKRAPRIGDPQ